MRLIYTLKEVRNNVCTGKSNGLEFVQVERKKNVSNMDLNK